jgi:hypothetical protein
MRIKGDAAQAMVVLHIAVTAVIMSVGMVQEAQVADAKNSH